jgi:hypothetical protein
MGVDEGAVVVGWLRRRRGVVTRLCMMMAKETALKIGKSFQTPMKVQHEPNTSQICGDIFLFHFHHLTPSYPPLPLQQQWEPDNNTPTSAPTTTTASHDQCPQPVSQPRNSANLLGMFFFLHSYSFNTNLRLTPLQSTKLQGKTAQQQPTKRATQAPGREW